MKLSKMKKAKVNISRVYDDPNEMSSQYRVLIDRLWPRGVKKDSLDYDEWLKQVAPSSDLRKWYSHEASKFQEFKKRYLAELEASKDSAAIEHLIHLSQETDLTLLTATKDISHSSAIVLKHFLESA